MTKATAIWISLVAVLGTSLFAGAAPAMGIEYPWCFISMVSGGQHCRYSSVAECQATLAGIGGVCAPNPRYRAEAASRQKVRPPR